MCRWYSPRGARRGFLLAMLTVMMWLCWALGYIQGRAHAASIAASLYKSSLVRLDVTACTCRV